MQRRVAPWLLVGSMLAGLGLGTVACEGKHADAGKAPPPGKQPRGEPVAAAKTDADAPAPTPEPTPTPEPAPAADDGGAPAPDAKADDFGRRFADPDWFRKSLFADAKKATSRRSERDANDFFTSSILFELADGATVDTCVKTVEAAVKADVPDLKSEKLDDGRVQLKGNADHYEVTIQCGAPKGPVMAFVSYRWTSDPAGDGA